MFVSVVDQPLTTFLCQILRRCNDRSSSLVAKIDRRDAVPRHLLLDLLMTIFLPVTTPNSMNDTPGFVSIAKGTMYSCTLNVDE